MKRRMISLCLATTMLMTSIAWGPMEAKASFVGKQQALATVLPQQEVEKTATANVQANSYGEQCVSMIPSLKLTPNYGWSTDGEWVSLIGNANGEGKIVSTAPADFIPVVEGENYVITTNRVYWVYNKGTHILFTDENRSPVACEEIDYTQNLTDKIVHVPAGATRMYLTYYCNQTFRLDKIVGSIGQKDMETLVGEESKLIYDAVQKEETADKDFSYKFDKAKITFVLDDVRGDVNLVYDIFKEYGFKNICIAAVPENFSQITAGATKTRREVMDEIVENKGEILAHYGEPLKKKTYTKTEIRKRFKETKEKIEAFGYDVNGIILAGGVGYDSINFEDVEKWSRYYYDYSDLYGANKPYRKGRASIAYAYSNQAIFEEDVNVTIQKKDWLVLYMHDLNEISEEKLRMRLAYVQKCVQAGSVDVVTYKKLHDDFGIKNNGTTKKEYGGIDYLAREDIEGYLNYSDQKKLENGVNEYYSERILQDTSVECREIYISSSKGDDKNAGTIDAPKKNLEAFNKVNNLHIYLKAGDTFQLSEDFKPGNNVSINSYNEDGTVGVGTRPVLSGWDTLSGTWTKTSVPNVWEFDFHSISKLAGSGEFNGNTSMLKINGAVNFERYIFELEVDVREYAQRIAAMEQEVLVKEGQFLPFWAVDTANSKIYLYSGVDPNTQEIFYSAPYFGMGISNVNNVGVNHVEITGFSKHGISMSGVSKVNITDCYIHHIGGGVLSVSGGKPVKFGNAIEVWANGKDIYVGENIANWIFDTAYTNQTKGSEIVQENITFERNVANRCFWGMESWGDNCNSEGFHNITYHNNVVTNVCDITRPDVECYYGPGYTNYDENGEAMDGLNPYISCRTGGYYFSQMAGISAAVSNDQTSLNFTRNAILFSNRFSAILSTTDSGKFPNMQGNLIYSSLSNTDCKLVRGKTPEDTFFSFYDNLPGENNIAKAEHGAELLYYSDILQEASKNVEQCYEYPIVRIKSIVFDVDKKLFETGSTLDCKIISAKYEYNDGSLTNIAPENYTLDTSKVQMEKEGFYKIYLMTTNPENGEQLKADLTVEVSSDLSRFVWDKGSADGGKTAWEIRKNGDLYIEAGTSNYGGIVQYAKASDTPWYEYRDKVENVYLNQNYHYATNFFSDMDAVKKIYINANITGTLSLGKLPNLEDIIIEDKASVNAIGMDGSGKITSYDFSKIKGELNSVQAVRNTALEEATFYSLPNNNSALYSNPSLKKIRIANAPESGTGLEDAFLHVSGWNKSNGVERLYVNWLMGEVENAPWGLKGDFIISYADYDVTYVAGTEVSREEHTYGEYVSDGKVSCTQDGRLIKTCTTCGATYERVEEKLGHDYVDGICCRCGESNPSKIPENPEDPKDPEVEPGQTTASIRINSTRASLVVGEKKLLKVTSKKTGRKLRVTWKSSNRRVAKVTAKGIVLALRNGRARIVGTTRTGQKKVCTITVKKAPRKLRINKTRLSLKKGQKFRIRPTIARGTYTKYRFASSNRRVAKVSTRGVVTALKKGRARITVRTYNGLVKKCLITVK